MIKLYISIMEDLKLQVKQSDNYNLITLYGVLVFDNCEDFLEEITDLADFEKNVFLDLYFLEYVDSSGIGALFDIVKRLQKRNLQIYAYNLNPKVKQIFTLVKLSEFIKIIEKQKMEQLLFS